MPYSKSLFSMLKDNIPFSSLIILHHKTVGGEKTTRYGRVLSNPSFGSKIK